MFFGYLPKKWKRLARVLSIVSIPFTNRFFFYLLYDSGTSPENQVVFWFFMHIIFIPVISYTLKPFVVNK
jgi:hypothetical protein